MCSIFAISNISCHSAKPVRPQRLRFARYGCIGESNHFSRSNRYHMRSETARKTLHEEFTVCAYLFQRPSTFLHATCTFRITIERQECVAPVRDSTGDHDDTPDTKCTRARVCVRAHPSKAHSRVHV